MWFVGAEYSGKTSLIAALENSLLTECEGVHGVASGSESVLKHLGRRFVEVDIVCEEQTRTKEKIAEYITTFGRPDIVVLVISAAQRLEGHPWFLLEAYKALLDGKAFQTFIVFTKICLTTNDYNKCRGAESE